MSSASSNHSFVRDGASYDEVYPSGHKDLNSPCEERSPSASSPSSRDEGLGMERPEDDFIQDLDDTEPPIQSVVGPDGLRKFIMLPIWTVNDFISTIKEPHFKTLRYKYQILNNIPLRLPYKSEKCYYSGVKGVRVYEQMLKAGLRFPLSSLHCQLLSHLGLSANQISLNAWKVFLGMEVLYRAMFDDARRLTVWEFLHCYHPVEITQSKGMYSFVPRSPLLRLMYETPDSNKNWKSRYFFMEGDEWMCRPGNNVFMPVDTTWGILPPSSMYSSILDLVFIYWVTLIVFFLQFATVHKSLSKSGVFWKEFLTSPS